MSTRRARSLPSKSKKKKATSKRKRKEKGKKKREKRKKKKKKSNLDKPMCNCTWAFLSKNNVQFFPSVFSLF